MIAILLIVASLVASSIAQPVTYSFCSTAYSNVAGSPALPWSVQTSGTLTLTQSTNGLYQVTDAAGYRLIHARGQTSNQTITGVSPVGSYHHNDNLVSIASPHLSNDHSFSLRFGSAVEAVYFTSSEVNVLFKNTSIDIVQVDLPRNDGLINDITSTFTMAAGSSPSCPNLPMYPVSASALAAFNNRQTIPFCYAFSGGPGDGTPDQTLWTVSASGSFIISGLAGNSTNGGQTFIVLGVEGTRSYVDMYYNVVNRFLSVSPSSAAFSTKYPNFDDVGLTMRFDSPLFYWNGNSTSRLASIVIDGAFMFNELIGEYRNIPNVVGNFDVQTPGDTKPLQCGFDAGSLAQYQFCYRLRDPANVWDVVTYGQFTATGPVIRKDLSALTMHGMTGVRTVTNAAGRYTQNIIKLVYVNGVNASSGSTILNNNIVYVEGALPLDYYGMTYTLSSPAVFPDAVSPTADINLSAGSSKWYEWPVGAGDMEGVDPQHAGGYFNFNATQIVGEDYFPCDNSVTVPAMKRFYFCYQIATADYTIQASGMILAFGANITFEGRTGYAIANMTGARSFTRNGVTTYSAILSSNSESWGAINNTYSKILYPVAPHLDSLGVVIHVGADADTPLGVLVGEKVFDLSVGTNGNLTELGFTSGGRYSGVGWMMITEDESKVACQVNPTSNSASAVATSVLSVLLMVVVALAL